MSVEISIHAPREGSDSKDAQKIYALLRINRKIHEVCASSFFCLHEKQTASGIFAAPNRCEAAGKSLHTSPSQLQNQGVLRQISCLAAKVFNLVFISLAQVVKPQAVFLGIHDSAKLCLK